MGRPGASVSLTSRSISQAGVYVQPAWGKPTNAAIPYIPGLAKRQAPWQLSGWPRGNIGSPAGAGILPFVVRQLPNIGAIGAHDKNLTVGLGRTFVERPLILETFARTAENDPLAIPRPRGMRIHTWPGRKPLQP